MDAQRLALIHRMVAQRQTILDWFDELETMGVSRVTADPGETLWRTLMALEMCLGRETALAFRGTHRED